MTRLLLAYRSHRGAVRITAILVLAVAVLALSWMTMYPRSAQADPQPPTASALAVALIQCGLDAKSLCAAGVPSGSISGVVSDVREEMTDHPGSLETAQQSLGSARSQHDQLQRLIQSGLGTAQDLTTFASASSSLSSAQGSVNSTLSSLFTAGTADLATAQRNILSTTKANRAAGWTHPVEFLTVTRTEAQWVELRNALANERIALALGEAPSAEAQAILSAARSDGTVSSAIASLQVNLPAVEAAWTSALATQPNP